MFFILLEDLFLYESRASNYLGTALIKLNKEEIHYHQH